VPDRYEPILPPEALDPEYGVTDEERKPRHTPEERAAGLRALFARWAAEDAEADDEGDGYDVREALDAQRPPGSKLFREHEPDPA
jgi:hypothetical protein